MQIKEGSLYVRNSDEKYEKKNSRMRETKADTTIIKYT